MPNLSAWTATGSSISLVAATQPVSQASSPTDVNVLTNADKIALMNQYATELATKTSLDTTASGLSVSHTAYDNAVAAISTLLISAGAPSNWATTWPDGTTFGPVLGIQSSLSNAWATVATNRVALQGAISSAQAAAAQIAATAASQLHVVSWASTAKPSLPSSSYPAGYLAQTSDNLTFQVNAAGNAWTPILYAASGVFGQIQAGQIAAGAVNASMISAGVLTASYIYFTDGFCLNTLEPKEAGADGTAAHALTSTVVSTSTIFFPASQSLTYNALTGVGWTVLSTGSDTFNISGCLSIGGLNGSGNVRVDVAIYVDGAIVTPTFLTPGVRQYAYSSSSGSVSGTWLACLTGLTAGSHTIQVYVHNSPDSHGSFTGNFSAYGYASIQRIF